MRYLVGIVIVLALPLSASAQGTDNGWVEEFYPELAPREAPQPPPSEPALESTPEEPAQWPEPAPGEPALQLKLDDSGVEVAPGYPRRFDEMKLRVKRARTGVIINSAIVASGVVFVAGGAAYDARNPPDPNEWFAINGYYIAGGTLFFVGTIGMIVSGGVMAHRNRELRRRKDEYYRRVLACKRRAQWDVARSRLVF